ncbi:hypothetical protein GGF31_001688 [Allomyces arbusculus]|nr:hypothetical protein GGF31_001688 [Allomyces arbusculus]
MAAPSPLATPAREVPATPAPPSDADLPLAETDVDPTPHLAELAVDLDTLTAEFDPTEASDLATVREIIALRDKAVAQYAARRRAYADRVRAAQLALERTYRKMIGIATAPDEAGGLGLPKPPEPVDGEFTVGLPEVDVDAHHRRMLELEVEEDDAARARQAAEAEATAADERGAALRAELDALKAQLDAPQPIPTSACILGLYHGLGAHFQPTASPDAPLQLFLKSAATGRAIEVDVHPDDDPDAIADYVWSNI